MEQQNIKQIKKLVDFCNNMGQLPTKMSKVIHETECILLRRPELDVNCPCFRHNAYAVHGKWFFEK